MKVRDSDVLAKSSRDDKDDMLKNILAYCGYSTSPFFLLLSEHKHCDNMATNSNSKNARSKQVASLREA